MYVRIAAAIRAQPAAAAVDPFRVQKLAAFTKSAAQVTAACRTLDLIYRCQVVVVSLPELSITAGVEHHCLS